MEVIFFLDKVVCFFRVSRELISFLISLFLVVNILVIFDLVLFIFFLVVDNFCCSCFIRFLDDLLSFFC